ncbi:MAG: hypothetical protein LBT71_00950 [Azoarcus sp.]|jgi:hypothetical protein|nr:hypothetical protein [Azoarcus sp.]
MPTPPRPFRLLLLPGVLALLSGVLGGLFRLGWPVLPAALSGGGAWHGALMMSAFFGTVIGMEKAVASGSHWPFLAPLASGCGGIFLLAGGPPAVAAILSALAATILLAASLATLKRQHAAFVAVAALGASCWLLGSLCWLWTDDTALGAPAWLSFIVLTIAGERLELTRLVATPDAAKRTFALIVAILPVGLALALAAPAAGLTLQGAGLLGLAIWLARYDIARRNLWAEGLTRFIAICLMGGYGFLAVGGLLGLAGGLEAGHRWHDATLHAVTLGFVFSMVLGHALIVLPAIARIRVPYGWVFYVPLAVLHLSLAVRIGGGLAGQGDAIRYGALGNALALLLFIAILAVQARRGAIAGKGARAS